MELFPWFSQKLCYECLGYYIMTLCRFLFHVWDYNIMRSFPCSFNSLHTLPYTLLSKSWPFLLICLLLLMLLISMCRLFDSLCLASEVSFLLTEDSWVRRQNLCLLTGKLEQFAFRIIIERHMLPLLCYYFILFQTLLFFLSFITFRGSLIIEVFIFIFSHLLCAFFH